VFAVERVFRVGWVAAEAGTDVCCATNGWAERVAVRQMLNSTSAIERCIIRRKVLL
jgi:hypothetical protein